MIKISKISPKNSRYLFLGIFLSFLIISFLHSHHYSLPGSTQIIAESPSKAVSDIFLDSEFNCIIHTFINNIQFEDSFHFSEEIYNNEIILRYSYHFYSSNHNLTNKQLRAPPSNLV